MFSWAIILLVVARIADALGLSGVVGAAIHIAWVLAIVSVVLSSHRPQFFGVGRYPQDLLAQRARAWLDCRDGTCVSLDVVDSPKSLR